MTKYLILTLTCLALLCTVPVVRAADRTEAPWPGEKAQWKGYDQYKFNVNNAPAYVVVPKEALPGNPWIWRARFPDYHAEMDQDLVGKGFHIGYIDVAGLFGGPPAMERAEKFYEFATHRGLAKKPAMEGVSRGGLFVYNWAAEHPDRVACIYCDTPVLDFKSWPAGRGNGVGSPPTWQQCMKAYGLTEEQALAYDKNPIDRAKPIAEAKIPILHIVSDSDRVVPPKENTDILAERLKAAGHEMQIIRVKAGTAKSSGHHFTHPEPKTVVEFIQQHAGKPGE